VKTGSDQGPGAARREQLLAKRRSRGLSPREANELGRLIAERDEQPYANARNVQESAEEPRRRRGHSEEFLSSSHLMHDPLLLPPRGETVESELDAPALFGAPEKRGTGLHSTCSPPKDADGLRGLTLGAMWTMLVGGAITYETDCQVITLD
jgi:hypothetical protein